MLTYLMLPRSTKGLLGRITYRNSYPPFPIWSGGSPLDPVLRAGNSVNCFGAGSEITYLIGYDFSYLFFSDCWPQYSLLFIAFITRMHDFSITSSNMARFVAVCSSTMFRPGEFGAANVSMIN